MRYTRLEIGGKNKRESRVFLFQFLVIIPVVSVIMGYLISNLFIIPKIKPSGEETGVSAQAGQFKTSKIGKLYFLQSGFFSKEEKAGQLSEGIMQSGLLASVGVNKGKYRVITGVSNNREEIQRSFNSLKSLGYGGIINTIDIQILDNSSVEELKLIREYVNISTNLISYQNEKIDKLTNEDLKKIELELRDGLSQLQVVYGRLPQNGMRGEVEKEIKGLNDSFLQNIEQFLQSAGAGEKEKCLQNICNEVSSLYDFYRVVLQSYSN